MAIYANEHLVDLINDEYEKVRNLKALLKKSLWCIECLYEEIDDDDESETKDMYEFIAELKEAVK